MNDQKALIFSTWKRISCTISRESKPAPELLVPQWYLSPACSNTLLHSTIRTQASFWDFVVTFCIIFRKSMSQEFKRVVQRWFEVRWKVLTLAHRTVGQTSESEHLEPICWVLKLPDCRVIGFGIGKNVDKILFFFGNSDISNVTRLVHSGRIRTLYPPLNAPRSRLSNGLRISAVRHSCERLAPYFWKRSTNT